jgi:hypothetical protein
MSRAHWRILITGMIGIAVLASLCPFVMALSFSVTRSRRAEKDWLASGYRDDPAHRVAEVRSRPDGAATRSAAVLVPVRAARTLAGSASPSAQAISASSGPDPSGQATAAESRRAVPPSSASSSELNACLDDLLGGLKTDGEREALRAVSEISRLGAAFVPIILQRLQTAGTPRAPVLAAALLRMDDAIGSAYFSARLSDGNEETKMTALAALALARNRSAMELLIDALEKGPAPVAGRATGILAGFAGATTLRVEDALESHIVGHDDPFAAARALADLGTDESRRRIEQLASSPDRANGQVAALQAIVVLGKQVDPEVVVKALRGAASPVVLKQAAITAGRLRAGPAVPALIETLEDCDSWAIPDVTWALGAITGETLAAEPALWASWWETVGRHKEWSPADRTVDPEDR